MKGLLLDTHTLFWWSSRSQLLSRGAVRAIERAGELLVASITWFELATLAQRGKIDPHMPVRTWLEGLAGDVETIPTTPAIAATAVALPRSFPGDPADRIIYATAIELGCRLVTKDERMRAHPHPRRIAIW